MNWKILKTNWKNFNLVQRLSLQKPPSANFFSENIAREGERKGKEREKGWDYFPSFYLSDISLNHFSL